MTFSPDFIKGVMEFVNCSQKITDHIIYSSEVLTKLETKLDSIQKEESTNYPMDVIGGAVIGVLKEILEDVKERPAK